jgi:hypothetical protein
MKLVEMKNWELKPSEEVWGLLPFKALLDRDDTEEKEIATKELLFIFFWCDIKSDYIQIDEENREEEIAKDIGLPKGWVKDHVIDEAIELFEKLSGSVIQRLYRQTLQAASDIGDYLENTKEVLAERDMNNKPVTDISKVTGAIQKIPKLMADLSAAYKEVIKEQENLEGKKKGSQTFNIFERGLDI